MKTAMGMCKKLSVLSLSVLLSQSIVACAQMQKKEEPADRPILTIRFNKEDMNKASLEIRDAKGTRYRLSGNLLKIIDPDGKKVKKILTPEIEFKKPIHTLKVLKTLTISAVDDRQKGTCYYLITNGYPILIPCYSCPCPGL